jgi:hypothetical protein
MKELWINIHLASLIGSLFEFYLNQNKNWWLYFILIFISMIAMRFSEK